MRAADAEDHRPVPLQQGRERQLRGVIAPGREPLEELRVGQPADGTRDQERADRPDHQALFPSGHARPRYACNDTGKLVGQAFEPDVRLENQTYVRSLLLGVGSSP